ncbi:hypothetical protein ACQKNC_07560, partial [Lysinibacillus sp. NPDC094177]|uniref:hypothetical protein n=1 Tax=Lysinibacillus sp. NPDC094177 TaxID=3390580 RepID=UPI003D00B2AC
LLPLRFRAKTICCCRFAFAQKPTAAAASLSRKNHLLARRLQESAQSERKPTPRFAEESNF